jgi:hypothetical protein
VQANVTEFAKVRQPRPAFRKDDTPMEKLNGFFGRNNWITPFLAIAATLFSGYTLLRTNLGFTDSIPPVQRIVTLEHKMDAVGLALDSLRNRSRPLLVNLCFEASDTVLALIQRDVNCGELIPRRLGRGN